MVSAFMTVRLSGGGCGRSISNERLLALTGCLRDPSAANERLPRVAATNAHHSEGAPHFDRPGVRSGHLDRTHTTRYLVAFLMA